MKKSILALCLSVLAVTLLLLPVFAARNPDLDADGKITSLDAQSLRIEIESGSLDGSFDLDGNGSVDVFDLILLISALPAEPETTPAQETIPETDPAPEEIIVIEPEPEEVVEEQPGEEEIDPAGTDNEPAYVPADNETPIIPFF